MSLAMPVLRALMLTFAVVGWTSNVQALRQVEQSDHTSRKIAEEKSSRTLAVEGLTRRGRHY
jgi:hypothetical protein